MEVISDKTFGNGFLKVNELKNSVYGSLPIPKETNLQLLAQLKRNEDK